MPETTKKILEWYSKATKVEIIKTTITTIARTVIDPSPLDRATIGIGQSLHTKNKETAIVKITARKNPKTKNEANRRVQTRPTITTKNGVEETIHHFFVNLSHLAWALAQHIYYTCVYLYILYAKNQSIYTITER